MFLLTYICCFWLNFMILELKVKQRMQIRNFISINFNITKFLKAVDNPLHEKV